MLVLLPLLRAGGALHLARQHPLNFPSPLHSCGTYSHALVVLRLPILLVVVVVVVVAVVVTRMPLARDLCHVRVEIAVKRNAHGRRGGGRRAHAAEVARELGPLIPDCEREVVFASKARSRLSRVR